ncbi:MAG: hypothetical protein WCO57_08645 [Verrucomicrobiota bacterium]
MKTNLLVRQTRAARHSGGSLGKSSGAWAACGLFLLSGCSHDPAIDGLRPLSPPQRMHARLSENDAQLEFPKVASNLPVLEWEAYVPPERATAPNSVTYDLRVWEMRYGKSARLIYERTALPAPYHQVECRLKPATPHFWSVRARVASGGQTLLTDWSRSRRPCQSFASANRQDAKPAPNYFRFVTSGGINDEAISDFASWRNFFAAGLPASGSGSGSTRDELASWGALFAGDRSW